MGLNNDASSNTSDIVLKKFLPMFVNDTVSAKSVNRDFVPDGSINPDTGERIRVKRPHQYRDESTPDGDLTSATSNNIISGTAEAVVQNYITVFTDWKNIEVHLRRCSTVVELINSMRQHSTDMRSAIEESENILLTKIQALNVNAERILKPRVRASEAS